MTRGRLAAIGLAGVALAAGAAAQDEGPIVIGREQELETLRFEDLRIAIEAFARRRVDEVDPRFGPKTRDVEDLFRETLELSSGGFIGHPNLIELDLMGRFRLSQEDLDSDSLDMRERSLENINEFDVSALILRQSKMPLTLYARRDQVLLDRQFGSSIDNLTTEYGASLRWRSEEIPTFFRYFHRDQEQASQFGITDFQITQDTFEWQSQSRPAEGHLLTWDYSFDSVAERGELRRANSFDRHDGLLVHTYDFGSEDQHQLRSSFDFLRESGDFALDRIRWDERLRLRHSDTFETRYDYMLDHQERGDSRQTLNRGVASFRHQLFESLVTTGEIGASHLGIAQDGFASDQIFGTITTDYTKRVPYGEVTASFSLNLDRQEDSDRGATIQITDEPRTFSSSGLIVLSTRNIELDSVVITDSVGVIVFSEGADYTVRAFGERVEIRQVLGGDIAQGQTVLIDYRLGPEPGATTTTTGYGATVRYDLREGPLKGLGLYVRYFQQDQDLTTRQRDLRPEIDIEDLVYGMDYNLGNLTLLAEQQIHDSTLSPFDANRLEARWSQRLGRGSSMLFAATYREIDHTDEDFRTTTTTLTGRWNQQLTQRLRAGAELIWRMEDDSAGIDAQGFEQRLDLTWRYRQTTLFAEVRNAFIDSDANDTLFQTFMLGFRREF